MSKPTHARRRLPAKLNTEKPKSYGDSRDFQKVPYTHDFSKAGWNAAANTPQTPEELAFERDLLLVAEDDWVWTK